MLFFKNKSDSEVNRIQKLNKPHNGNKLVQMQEKNVVIDVKNVNKSYVSGSVVTNILKNVNLKIYDGDFVVILGPSGSGKTTLMNIISGLDRATEGEINVLGNNLINLNDDELTKFRRMNVGYIFQQYGLIPNLKVHENISIGNYLSKLNKKEMNANLKSELNTLEKQRSKELSNSSLDFARVDTKQYINKLDFFNYIYYSHHYFQNNIKKFIDEYAQYSTSVNLLANKINQKYDLWSESIIAKYDEWKELDYQNNIDDIMQTLSIDSYKDKYPSQLSGGQQQRVSIARVFAKKPKIIFADEPTGAVDLKMSDVILNAFLDINKKYNTTIMIVTHNPDIAKLATKVIHFKEGYIESIINQKQNIV